VEELAGRAPSGPFAEIERARHLELLAAWRAQLCERAGDRPPVQVRAFGRAGERTPAVQLSPPIHLEAGDARAALLFGETQPLVAERDALGSILPVAGAIRDKHFLRGFLDGAALAAAGVAEGRPHRVTVVGASGAEVRAYPAWTQDEARAYLGRVVADLLGSAHDYLLPCELVFARRRKPDAPFAALAGAVLARASSRFGPIRSLDGLKPPAAAEADAIIERRFDRFFGHEVVG
jgi:exodeoxyribonuclease V gamma subunit